MTLKEAFEQGACKVGNLIILEGGQSFLIGEATPETAPDDCYASCLGWGGWWNKKVVYIFDLLDQRTCAMLEQYKTAAAVSADPEPIKTKLVEGEVNGITSAS